MSQVYLFRTFEEASYFLEKFGSRRCRGVLGDQCEYNSEISGEERLEIDIPDVLAQIVPVQNQDGRDLIPRDSSSIASRYGWAHPSWSSPSSQMAIDGVWTSARSSTSSAAAGICALISSRRQTCLDVLEVALEVKLTWWSQ